MAAFVGNYGFIELKRDAVNSTLQTILDPSDVNVSKQRFSVDFAQQTGFDESINGTGSAVVPLITGDRIEIKAFSRPTAANNWQTALIPLKLLRNNIDAQGEAGNKLTVLASDLGGPSGTTLSSFWYAVAEVDSGGGITKGYIENRGYDNIVVGTYTNVPFVAYPSDQVGSGDSGPTPTTIAQATIVVTEYTAGTGLGNVTSVTITSVGAGYEACDYKTDALVYVHVDEMGGLRLFDSFAKSLSGLKTDSFELVAPTQQYLVEIKTRNAMFRNLAQTTEYSFTTSRESIDTTRLGDEFRRQHEGGLITGQGRLTCVWDFRFRDGDTTPVMREDRAGAHPEFAQYLSQLCLRIKEGANFAAKFFIYYPGDDATTIDNEPSVWYEVMCQVTNSVMDVSVDRIITTEIEFVATSIFGLMSDKPPMYILTEQTIGAGYNMFILDEDGNPSLMEDVD